MERAKLAIENRNLGEAISIVKQLPERQLLPSAGERLEQIEEDYDRMLSFMSAWYDDPQRGKLYSSMLYRLWVLLSDIEMAYRRNNVRSYINAVSRTKHLNTSHNFIQSVLRGYVTDMAMNTLNSNDEDDAAEEELHERHYRFMVQLFDYIWTSYQWDDSEAEFYSNLIVSAAVDVDDALMLTSAIFLGTSEMFDLNKFKTLVNIYRRATNDAVKHTAFATMMLAQDNAASLLYDWVDTTMQELGGEEAFRTDVATLQAQALKCMNAENDREIIEGEIMPTFLKNKDVAIKNIGLVDDETSSLEEILNPGQQDKILEELEQQASRMAKMQKEGADVYFGSFEKTKNMPFFKEMVHWWMPYSVNNPRLPKNVRKILKGKNMISLILDSDSYCSSDMYSLASMCEQIVRVMPKDAFDLDVDGGFLLSQMGGNATKKPSNVWRNYLQNIYRFYKLYPDKQDFRDPFLKIFVDNRRFDGEEWDGVKLTIARELTKQKRWRQLETLLDTMMQLRGEAAYLMGCARFYGSSDYAEALEYFKVSLEEMPSNERVSRLMARCFFMTGRYRSAEETYMTLYENTNDKPTYCLNACISMIQQEKYDEAIKQLYQLDYQYENNNEIQVNLAWALLMGDRKEKARDLFSKIIEKGSNDNPNVLIGLGYCHWFLRNITSAVECFKRYMYEKNATETELAIRVFDDQNLLDRNQITKDEVYMMADLCRK